MPIKLLIIYFLFHSSLLCGCFQQEYFIRIFACNAKIVKSCGKCHKSRMTYNRLFIFIKFSPSSLYPHKYSSKIEGVLNDFFTISPRCMITECCYTFFLLSVKFFVSFPDICFVYVYMRSSVWSSMRAFSLVLCEKTNSNKQQLYSHKTE